MSEDIKGGGKRTISDEYDRIEEAQRIGVATWSQKTLEGVTPVPAEGHGTSFVPNKVKIDLTGLDLGFGGARAEVPKAPPPARTYDDACAGLDTAPGVVNTDVLHPKSLWCRCPECTKPIISYDPRSAVDDPSAGEGGFVRTAEADPDEPIPFTLTEKNDITQGADPENKYAGTHNKLRYNYLPPYGLALAASGFTFGGTKYWPFGWRNTKLLHSELIGAAMRHIENFMLCEEVDADSGLPPLSGAICSLMILADHTILHPEWDDRGHDEAGPVTEAIAKLRKTLEARLPALRAKKAGAK